MDYQFESILSDKMIDIYFTASAKLKNNLKNLIKLSVKKPIKSLQSEMILADTKNKESLSIDLNKTILYIPADTILSGSVNISSNICIINFLLRYFVKLRLDNCWSLSKRNI